MAGTRATAQAADRLRGRLLTVATGAAVASTACASPVTPPSQRGSTGSPAGTDGPDRPSASPSLPGASSREPNAPRDPIGAPDEMVVVSALPGDVAPTLVVELVGGGGRRRPLARLANFGLLAGDLHRPFRGMEPIVSDRGFLALLTESSHDPAEPATMLVADLRQPARAPLFLPSRDGGGAWGPDGQLTLLADDIDLVDAASGVARHVPVPPGFEVLPWPIVSGDGWYVNRRADGQLPAGGPTGWLALDGTLRDGPLPRLYDATGIGRMFGPDGERVDAVAEEAGRRVFTVARDGTVRDWYRFPDPRDLREFGNGEARWTSDGTGLWLIDQVPGAYRLVRVDRPGAVPVVVADWPYVERAGVSAPPIAFSGLSAGDAAIALTRYDVDPGAVRLLRIDTATGAVVEIPDRGPLGRGVPFGASFAGWASVPQD